MRRGINSEYFDWLFDLACDDLFPVQLSHRELLSCLHDIEFKVLIPNDENRAYDGMGLRRRFVLYQGYEDSYDIAMDMLDGPCSVLEMILALAIRCEESIMDDPSRGNRTPHWFWNMIGNLGLGSMTDDRFDELAVRETIDIFLNREYEPDGRGGLFTIRNRNVDLRKVEIWYQLCWYLDSIEF